MKESIEMGEAEAPSSLAQALRSGRRVTEPNACRLARETRTL